MNLRHFVFSTSLCLVVTLIHGNAGANDAYLRSIKLVKQKKYEQALKSIERAVEKEKKNHNYLAYMAFVLRHNKRYESALTYITKAIDLEKSVAWYYVEGVLIADLNHDARKTREYLRGARRFSKKDLGSANHSYLKTVEEKIQPHQFVLTLGFDPIGDRAILNDKSELCIPLASTDLPYQKAEITLANGKIARIEKKGGHRNVCLVATSRKKVTIKTSVLKVPFSYRNSMARYDPKIQMPAKAKIYLRSNKRLLLTSAKIKSLSNQVEGETDLETVNNTINWLNHNLKYGSPPKWKSVLDIIRNGVVECGSGSLVTVALLRANGIPARQVWGVIDAGRSYSPSGYLKGHVWTEVFLRGVGWVPVEQFDLTTLGRLPTSYIRLMTSDTDLYANKPLANIMTLMNHPKYGDIIKYTKTRR